MIRLTSNTKQQLWNSVNLSSWRRRRRKTWIILTVTCSATFVLLTTLFTNGCSNVSSSAGVFSLCFQSVSSSRTLNLVAPNISSDFTDVQKTNSKWITTSGNSSTIFQPPSSNLIKNTTLTSRNNFIVAISPQVGRLGNHMFQLASAYGIAKHNGRRLITREHFAISDFFQMKLEEFTVNDSIFVRYPSIGEEKVCSFDKKLYTLSGFQDYSIVYLNSYMQSWMYFAEAFDDIRKMFTLKPDLQNEVNAFFAKIKPNPSDIQQISNIGSVSDKVQTTFVGIHVRRGDMLTDGNRIFGYKTGNSGFIERAMRHFVEPRRFHHVTFVVCSDDLEWCWANVKLSNSNVSAEAFSIVFCGKNIPNTPVVDLGILAACNHSIITGGTFGWWSAFLAGGETVYYSGYPRFGSKLDRVFSPSKADFWLPKWIGMD